MEENKTNFEEKLDGAGSNEKVINEDIAFSEDLEKQSYSNYMYKKLIKARKKGIQYGVDVPKLKYALDKPEKPRKMFKVIGYVMLALTILTAIGFIVAYIVSGVFPMFIEMIKGTVSVYSKETLAKSFGLSSIVAFSMTYLYIIISVLLILPIFIVSGLISFVIKNFSLTTISKQEMAQGFEITKYINGLIIVMVLSLFAVGYLFLEGLLSGSLGIFITVVGILLFTLSLTISICLIKERKKEKVWFDSLDEEKKQDFINQNNAIKKLNNLKGRNTGSILSGRY